MVIDLTTRRGWGARTNRIGRPMGQVSLVCIHHWWRPDIPPSASRAIEQSAMRGVEGFHASKNWSAAPGYAFCVCDSGRVYVGTGWGRQGVHAVGINSRSVGLAFANDGDSAQPTEQAWETMTELVAWGVELGHITTDYELIGHRDVSDKSCPGNKTYPHIERIRDGASSPSTEEDDMLTPHSPEWLIRLYQAVLRWWGDMGGISAAAGLVIDGVWGKATEAAHIAVAAETRYTARTKGRVFYPQFTRLLHAVPPEWFDRVL